MMNIVVFKSLGLEDDQISRLEQVGDISWIDIDKDSLILEQLQAADVICAEEPIAKYIYDLKDVFVSFPFVGVGWLDLDRLAKNGVLVANAPGCNKAAVSEWIIAMMLIQSRKLLKYINIGKLRKEDFLEPMPGLAGNSVVILGDGNIGSTVGKICGCFDMEVSYYRRGDNLIAATSNSDFIVNCLGRNEETEGLLDKAFFTSLRDGAFFISITDVAIFDRKSLLEELDNGRLSGVAIDPAGVPIFSTDDKDYKIFREHSGVIATPHIAFHTNRTLRIANDIMVKNVESWATGKPINVVDIKGLQ